MPGTKRSKDVNQWAKALVDFTAEEEARPKNAAAVSLGRLGGLKGGKARAEALTKEQRSEIARKAARARWTEKDKNDVLAAVRNGVSSKEISKQLGVVIPSSANIRKKAEQLIKAAKEAKPLQP